MTADTPQVNARATAVVRGEQSVNGSTSRQEIGGPTANFGVDPARPDVLELPHADPVPPLVPAQQRPRGGCHGARARLLAAGLRRHGHPRTPWGTWLSGEENPNGLIHECTVEGTSQGVPLPALGTFSHEAVTFDDGRGQRYLTEDTDDGRLYRFTPEAYPDLTAGRLEVLAADDAGAVTWLPAQNPDQPQAANRVAGSKEFDGGEGIWFDSDHVYFTTKGDNRVWDLDVGGQRLAVLYDAEQIGPDAPLTGVDNIVVSRSADIFVAEDGGDLEIVIITPESEVAPVVRLVGHDASEITGPAFSPDGSRLYFSSQRGTDGRGVTFEVAGPFRTERTGPPARGTFAVPPTTAPHNEDPAPGAAATPPPSPASPPVVQAALARRVSGDQGQEV